MQYTKRPPSPDGFKNTTRSGGGGSRRVGLVPICPAEQSQRVREAQREDAWRRMLDKMQAKRRVDYAQKPAHYVPPAYNTPEYWRDCTRGWISDEQQRSDHADYETRRRRAIDSKHNKAAPPHRHERAAPRPNKQFSKPMATQAARDDRLTPQSKALLQVLVARTGRGRFTNTTKTTLGVIMNRCPRSIQRYIRELVKFGYIRTQTVKSRRTGFFIGMRVWIMNSVLPFFAKRSDRYDPGKWPNLLESRRNPEETEESPNNSKERTLRMLDPQKPPWFVEFAYGLERQ